MSAKPWELTFEAEKAPWELEYDIPKPQGGIMGALKQGAETYGSQVKTGVTGALTQEGANQAAIEGLRRQEALGQKYEAPSSWDAVKKAYEEKGLLSAAGETISQVPKAIAGQGAQLGAMGVGTIIGGGLGTMLLPGAGTVGGAAIGAKLGATFGQAITEYPQFFGAHLERQAQEQMKAGQPVDVSRANAAIGAAVSTAIDVTETQLLFGSKIISNALGLTEKTLANKSAAAVEKMAQEKILPLIIKGTVKGAAIELPSEIAQQMIERAQAGLSLTSPDAIKEYGDTAYQVSLLGPLGIAGKVRGRGEARTELSKREGEAAANAAIEQDRLKALAPTPPDETGQMGLNLTGAQEVAGPRQQFPITQEQPPLAGPPQQPMVGPEQPSPQGELDFNQPYPKSPLQAAPTIIGQEQAKPPQISDLDWAKMRLESGAPLTPTQQFLLQEDRAKQQTAFQAAPTPQLEIPNVVGAGARPTSYVVDDAAIDTFGTTKAAKVFKNAVRGLDLMNPEDAAKFDKLVEQHERKGAKIDMDAVEAFRSEKPEPVAAREVPEQAGLPAVPYDARKGYQQAREANFAFGQTAAPLSPRDITAQTKAEYDGRTGAEPINGPTERGVQLPSVGLQTPAGTTTPEATGVGSAVGATTPANRGTGVLPQAQSNPLAQMVQQVAPTTAPAIPQETVPRVETKEALEDQLAKEPISADTEELLRQLGIAKAQRANLEGGSTINLIDRVTQGDLKGALQEIVNDKTGQFTPLDKEVASRLLQSKTLPKIEVVDQSVIPDGSPAQYNPNTDTVQIVKGQIDSHTVLHETLHGFLHVMIKDSDARVAQGFQPNPMLKNLQDIYNAVKNNPALLNQYGLKDLSEFVSEAFSNPKFQVALAKIPYKRMNVFSAFGRAVLRALGIKVEGNVAQTDALTATLIAAEHIMTHGRNVQTAVGARSNVGIAPAQVVRTPQGQDAESLMSAFGGKPADVKHGFVQRQVNSFNKAKDTWTEAYEGNNSWVASTFGKGQNIASFDQAFNNRLYTHYMGEAKKGNMVMEDAKKALLRISTSQALHRGNLANQIIEKGDYIYDAPTNRWDSKADPINMTAFEGLIKKLATKLGVEPTRARQMMGAAYEANRLNGMYKSLDKTEQEIASLEKEMIVLRKNRKRTAADKKTIDTKQARLDKLKTLEEDLNGKVQHKTKEQVDAGMKLYNAHPEIAEGTKVWNKMRERVVKLLVETGVKTEDEAQRWLDEAAYVPFFRDMEDQKAAGPQVMARGLRESMVDRTMKGSMREVQDPIENMYQWMQRSIARAISNKQLQVMLSQYAEALPNEVRSGEGGHGNTFTIYYDGTQRKFNVADPAIAQAFVGLEPIIFPGIGAAVSATNALRHIITRFPLFSAVQLFNDSYTAMFTSGLKSPFGVLKEIAKEVAKTAQGTSETRKMLIGKGILETHDYTAMNEEDAIAKRLDLDNPSSWKKLMRNLDRLSSASDNVIRQGVYNQAIKEKLSHEEAMEKAAEIVNFRRISGDPRLQFASRVIPFFNAYLQVGSVAVKTLSGRGISPAERKAAQATLLATTAKIAVLSMLYSMAIGDDEDYKKKNRTTRDRMFMIPGTGGMGIPIRTDVFALPKIIGEYTYQMMADNSVTDSKMFKQAMGRAVMGSLAPPSEGIPQIVRPVIEVATNHDFFQGREIVNATMRRLDVDRQFTKSTSEMAKGLSAIAGTVGVEWSPLNIDHFLRGYFGSAMTLTALATDDAINAVRGGPPRPAKSAGDMLASLPNMSGFISKDENTAVLSDFYEVARDVNKANATLKSMKHMPMEEQRAYREEHKKEIQLKSMVHAVEKQLVTLKQREQIIRENVKMPDTQKQAELKRITDQRDRMAKNVTKIRQRMYE